MNLLIVIILTKKNLIILPSIIIKEIKNYIKK